MNTIIIISIVIASIILGFLLIFVIYYNAYHIIKNETSSSKVHSTPLNGGVFGIMFSALLSSAKSLYPVEINKRSKPSEGKSDNGVTP